ncbi:MAG: hypothetical protein HQ463_06945 [Bacteroidetes bacterium]|nr:hypothetical protein [Bacteroidota bacterium]
MKRLFVLISLLIFLFSLSLGVFYFKERVLYLDSAYAVFNLINNGFPAIEHGRYSFYLLEIFPWLGLKLGFTIPTVLALFSISHILLAFISFGILLKIKQPKLALLLTVFQVLSYRESYFLALNETSLLISASLLLAGFLVFFENKKHSLLSSMTVFLILISITLFCHPMAILILPFIVFTHWVSLNYKLSLNLKIVSILMVSILALKILLIPDSDYENKLYFQLSSTFDIALHLKLVYSFNFFYGDLRINSYFIMVYFIPTACFIILAIIFFKQKKYVFLITYVSYVFILWTLIIVVFNKGDGNIFMEKNFTPWVIICLYPIVLCEIKYNKFSLILLISVVFYSFFGIFKVSNIYINRYEALDKLLTQNYTKNNKLLINDSLINHEEMQGTWALPYETLLLSKIKKIPKTTIRVYKNEPNINKELNRNDIFLGADFMAVLPATYLLNQNYFELEKTTYLIITNQ